MGKVPDRLRIKSFKDQSITQVHKAANPYTNDELWLHNNTVEAHFNQNFCPTRELSIGVQNQSRITELRSNP